MSTNIVVCKYQKDCSFAYKINNNENINTNSWFNMSKQYSLQQKKCCNIKHKTKDKELVSL